MCDEGSINVAEQSLVASTTFAGRFRVFSILDIGRSDLEQGDKIVVPPSVQDTAACSKGRQTVVLELKTRSGRKSYCGVSEFVAQEGHTNAPSWVMRNLDVVDGDIITLQIAEPPKGTYVKLEPQSSTFVDVTDPNTLITNALRNLTCLTKGDTIPVSYDNDTMWFKVLRIAPGDGVCIVDEDLAVEFAPTIDPQLCNGDTETITNSTNASNGQYSSNSSDEDEPGVIAKQRHPVTEEHGNSLIFRAVSSPHARPQPAPTEPADTVDSVKYTPTTAGEDPAERLKTRLAKLTRRSSGSGLGSEADSSDETDSRPRQPKRVVYAKRNRKIRGKTFQAVVRKEPSESGCCTGCKCD